MLLSPASRFALAALLLAATAAHAQTTAADSTRLHPLARNLFGLGAGLGFSTVNADDDYFLPNDGMKLGGEVMATTFTHFFSRQDPSFGLRTGVNLLSRSGSYQFMGPYQGQEVRRYESFLTVPLELVTRRRLDTDSRWYSTAAIGGYFSELLSRYTYTLDPNTGKTLRTTDSGVYATGGLCGSISLGYQGRNHRYRELGLRLSADLFKPKSSDTGELPNLRQTNFSLFYSVSTGW